MPSAGVVALVFAVGLIAPAVADQVTSSAEATTGSGAVPGDHKQSKASPNRQPPKAKADRVKLHPLISQTARRHGVEPALVHAVVSAESAYDPNAVSRAGAIGLMQVMPATAADYGVPDSSALFDPAVNVNTGVRHLKRLLGKYGNDYGRVIMAYNAGEGVVDRRGGNVTYAETLGYTEAVIRRYRKLGGKQPIEAVLRKVSALRSNRGSTNPRQALPSDTGSALLLPKITPRLDDGNWLSPLQSPLALRSPTRAAVPARATDRSVIRSGLRTGTDPAVRQPMPARSSGTAAGRSQLHP
jgi:hypothetical protein